MYISRIALDAFRSWNHIICDFNPGINVIYGNNGLGKTNIVEALEVTGTGISHRTSSTLPLIKKGYEKSIIRINTINNDINYKKDETNTGLSNIASLESNLNQTTYEIDLYVKGSNRAHINSGKALYVKDIVGLLPIVSFTPRDQFLIIGDPNVRRTFIDQAGSLLVPNYVQLLQEFKHISKQRAALLKNIRDFSYKNQTVSLSGLEIWTGKFIESGINLTKARQETVQIINKYFKNIIKSFTNEENTEIIYVPSFEEVLFEKKSDENVENKNELFSKISEHFQRIYDGELARGCNLIGPHRDDIDFAINNISAKDFASNGESWTIAIASKMALCKALEEKNNDKPIVILDDVFAQLDENRRIRILNFALNQGQVFITTSSLSDIPNKEYIKKTNLINIGKLLEKNNEINNFSEEHNNILLDVIEQRKNKQEEK
ncbi:DNA replication/repair protein RecF [Gardnerella sp. DNF01151]|uniref:DNA replication/repair protein RecF n=1 Tax=Gardnerella sp. DNF01151 TaxID=2749059 RepID=UPI003BADA4AE